jgi:lysozyme family protein
MNLTDELRAEYERLFQECKIGPEWEEEVEHFCSKLREGYDQYRQVEGITGVPWFVVGLLHGLEGSFSFKTHLHNGDPLSHRTVNVPRGRPVKGEPPFSWVVSAIDALEYDNFTTWHDWSLAGICFKIEGYNGWGYRKLQHPINSPYLWSFSNLYDKGKFVGDGDYSATAESKQVGAITALSWLVNNHVVSLKAIGL